MVLSNGEKASMSTQFRMISVLMHLVKVHPTVPLPSNLTLPAGQSDFIRFLQCMKRWVEMEGRLHQLQRELHEKADRTNNEDYILELLNEVNMLNDFSDEL